MQRQSEMASSLNSLMKFVRKYAKKSTNNTEHARLSHDLITEMITAETNRLKSVKIVKNISLKKSSFSFLFLPITAL
jgi:hypothetical protein